MTFLFFAFSLAMAQTPQDLQGGAALPEAPPPLISGDAYVYDPASSRDPFKPYFTEDTAAPGGASVPEVSSPVDPAKLGLLGYDLDLLQLVGVLWGTKDPKGLVKAPSGKVYVVKKKTKIGTRGGFVALIREGEVVVVEPTGEGSKAVSRSLVLGKPAINE